ncbi:hypothetical protein DLM46_11510 [Paraburkholderia lacunae]|uniref:Uncharacterized protein n=1 Tax=Paraburkholderia lacunae TaxID=2211104 RepID=A0A370NBG1_9BURK|nr:hypothetical protein DLM46_11510 [Paraburkholderia lacunae]
MEETAECPNAVGGFAAMAIDRPGWSVVSDAARSGEVPPEHRQQLVAVQPAGLGAPGASNTSVSWLEFQPSVSTRSKRLTDRFRSHLACFGYSGYAGIAMLFQFLHQFYPTCFPSEFNQLRICYHLFI